MAPKADKKTSMEKASRDTRLSLVMIAKNEERYLAGCQQSASRWVNEIILVDTGSTDRTPEIAREFGAMVYHHAWENDFAKARNQALGYARGAWCLQLDADEELDQDSARQLKALLENPRAQGYRLRIDNLLPGGGVSTFHWPRLFRKTPEVHYFRKVHNQIHIPGEILDSQVRIIHHGYNLDNGGMEQRHGRRVSMIRQWAADEPDNWEAWYYLTQTLVSRPESVEESLATGARALGAGPRATALRPKTSPEYTCRFSRGSASWNAMKNCWPWLPTGPGWCPATRTRPCFRPGRFTP